MATTRPGLSVLTALAGVILGVVGALSPSSRAAPPALRLLRAR